MLGTARDRRFDFDNSISTDRTIYFYSIDPWHMNNPDHISESLENIFFGGVKILKFFDFDRIQDGKNSDPGPGIDIPDPQHCLYLTVYGQVFLFFFSYIKFYSDSYSNTQKLMFQSHAWCAWKLKGFLNVTK